MTSHEQKSKIVEITGPSIKKETDIVKLEEKEKNINQDSSVNLNHSKNSQDMNLEEENKNENNPTNIINMDQKEKTYADAETQKSQEIEKEESKEQNDLNEEKPQNLDITTNNNNLSNIISNNNKDIVNLVKSQSYLTSLPISNHRSNKQIKLNNTSRKTYNYLKEKENSLCIEINALKQKREQIINFGLDNLGDNSIIETNIRESELKKIKTKERNLMDKLESIKVQISDLINNEKKINRKNNIREYLEKLRNNDNNDIISKTKSIEAESNKYRQKHMIDLEKAKNKKINEINKKEEELKNKKILYLKAQREREIEIMRKRKKEIDEKIEKTKKSIQNKPNFDPKNYLYNKLANQYEESEKKFWNQQKMERKSKLSGPEEITIVKRRIIESKFELEKRRIEKTNEMHQLWHSRSLIMPKYQSNILKKINEYEAKQADDEEKEKIKKVVLAKEKERYGENVPLPPISEKLKGEREKRQITFLNFEGKDRVKCIKDEISSNKCKNKNCIVEEQIFKQNVQLQKYHQRISKSQEKKRNNKMVKSASCQNIIKNNGKDIDIKSIGGKPLSPVKLKMKRPHEINYLEDLKKERKNDNKNYKIDWNKNIQNSNNDMVKKQIEAIEEKYKREKDLMKVKGGYLNNQEIGNELNNMIINTIRGKLAIIENLNS